MDMQLQLKAAVIFSLKQKVALLEERSSILKDENDQLRNKLSQLPIIKGGI